MAIQFRKGIFSKFRKEKLLAGEPAVVLEGDASNAKGHGFYVAFGNNNATTVERMLMESEIPEILDRINGTIVSGNLLNIKTSGIRYVLGGNNITEKPAAAQGEAGILLTAYRSDSNRIYQYIDSDGHIYTRTFAEGIDSGWRNETKQFIDTASTLLDRIKNTQQQIDQAEQERKNYYDNMIKKLPTLISDVEQKALDAKTHGDYAKTQGDALKVKSYDSTDLDRGFDIETHIQGEIIHLSIWADLKKDFVFSKDSLTIPGLEQGRSYEGIEMILAGNKMFLANLFIYDGTLGFMGVFDTTGNIVNSLKAGTEMRLSMTFAMLA